MFSAVPHLTPPYLSKHSSLPDSTKVWALAPSQSRVSCCGKVTDNLDSVCGSTLKVLASISVKCLGQASAEASNAQS